MPEEKETGGLQELEFTQGKYLEKLFLRRRGNFYAKGERERRDVYKLPNYSSASLEGVMRRQEQNLQTLQLAAGKRVGWSGKQTQLLHLPEMKVLANSVIFILFLTKWLCVV